MRFLKEYVVLILIIVFLIGIDIFISNYTKNSIEKIDKEVDEIINLAIEENHEKKELSKKVDELEKKWKEIENSLAYFTEHDELEKVSVAIVFLKARIEEGEKEDAYERMQEIKYRIGHIKSKQQFKLNNIF